MAYDESLASRVRDMLHTRNGYDEKKMFGGLCFLLQGHMVCGVMQEKLMVRVGADGHADALRHTHAYPMDFTGKPMKGMVYVAPEGVESDSNLEAWVERGASFTSTLPPKKSK